MPTPYTAILSGIVLLGVFIFTAWNHSREGGHRAYGPAEDARARHDRTQNNDWGNDPDKKAGRSQRKKSGKSAVCEMCDTTLAAEDLKRFSCRHIFHDACVEKRQSCPTCGKPA